MTKRGKTLEIKQLSDEFAVTAQITLDDLETIMQAGFKSIICNRPDGEEPGQLTFAETEAAAQALGMKIRHVPVIPGQMSETDISEFSSALEELPGPVLAYCKSGVRSAVIWKASESTLTG